MNILNGVNDNRD